VSERAADPQVVCPFVAFDDERDFRSPVPDHRHRCFAESPAAPRALAHQAAYCLAPAFPGCPTFIDWARREAAPPKPEPAFRSPRDPAAAPRSTPATKSPGPGAVPPAEAPARRGDAGWAAPPPWAPAAAANAGVLAAGAGAEAAATPTESDEAVASETGEPGEPARADLAAPPRTGVAPAADGGDVDAEEAAPPAFLAGRGRPPAAASEWDADRPWQAGAGAGRPTAAPYPDEQYPHERYPDERYDEDELGDDRYAPPGRRPVAEPRRVPIGYAPVPPAKSGRRAGSRERRDPAAPTWEEPRSFEAYPTLKSRGGAGIPRPLVYALIVIVVGAALFATPFILRGLGGGGEGASPTPAATASAGPTVAPTPTPVPTPSQVVHVVKSGDTLSGIATEYGVTVDQILEANPQITNPNSIQPGDQIVIPQPLPTEIVDVEITPAP
jgi:LysM repeat protein